MTFDDDEFERRVSERLAKWQAYYAEVGVPCASPLLDRITAESEVAKEMALEDQQ